MHLPGLTCPPCSESARSWACQLPQNQSEEMGTSLTFLGIELKSIMLNSSADEVIEAVAFWYRSVGSPSSCHSFWVPPPTQRSRGFQREEGEGAQNFPSLYHHIQFCIYGFWMCRHRSQVVCLVRRCGPL